MNAPRTTSSPPPAVPSPALVSEEVKLGAQRGPRVLPRQPQPLQLVLHQGAQQLLGVDAGHLQGGSRRGAEGTRARGGATGEKQNGERLVGE